MFPFILNLLGALKIIEVTVYIAPISSAVAIICFATALSKFQFLNALPIALTKIVNRISDGYIVLNEKNIIIGYNRTFINLFEIENKSIDSIHLFDLLSIRSFSGLNEKYLLSALKAVKESNETLILEHEFKKINKYLRIEINNLKSDDAFIGSLILVKDITQHHMDVEIIKANQELLIEHERLASLGQMIGGIAHNLKTPIFSVAGGLEGLTDLVNEFDESIGDNTVTNEDMHEIAHDMNSWLEKLKTHISYMSEVITTVKGQAVNMSDEQNMLFTIDELFQHVNILMKHELNKKLATLKTNNLTIKGTQINGNINSLVQVINNLISNAIESYDSNKKEKIVELFAECDEQNRNVIISVKDYGKGLPKSVKEKLFKQMVTTKGKNGTGLGLFMSYSNIKAHFSGEITFNSEDNKGTTFNIIIPIK